MPGMRSRRRFELAGIMSSHSLNSPPAERGPIVVEPQSIPCLNSRRLVGDPVDVVTGANTDVTLDFRLPAPLPLLWHRYYNSAQNTVARSLGWGQTHDYDQTLTRDLDGLRYTTRSASDVPFPPLEEIGERAASEGCLLSRVTANTYQLLQPGVPIKEFQFSHDSDKASLRTLRQGKHRIDFRYDDHGRLVEIIDSLRRSIAVESDRDGRILGLWLASETISVAPRPLMVYEYDQAGNLITGRDLYGATLSFSWDQDNRMTRRTDRRGYSFHFTYDQQGRCTHSRGDDGLFEVLLDYQPDLKTTFVQRGDGGKWSYIFNAAGTVTQIVDPYGGSTRFALDDLGRVTQEIDPNGNATQFLYDDLGRHYARLGPLGHLLPTYEEDPTPPDPLAYDLPETPLEWEHGSLLLPRKIVPPDAADPVLQDFPVSLRNSFLDFDEAVELPKNGVTRHEEAPDEQVRPAQEAWPGQMAKWKYDPNGNLAEHQDRDGAVYRYVYNSWNALHQEIDPLGNVTVYDHSSQGLVSRVTDPGGTLTDYVDDLKDRLVEIRRNGQTRESYRYDAAGNIIERFGGNGQSLVTWEVGPATLDKSRRLSSGEVHTFKYDERGRITSAVAPCGVATFAFSEEGLQVEDKRDGLGVSHEFEGTQLAATTCFEKFRTSYSNDDNGDLLIADPTGAKHRIRYSTGGLVTKHLANGTRELSMHDSLGRCRRKTLLRDAYSRPWTRTFKYSRAGDLLAVTDSRQGAVHYRYDAAHRLSEETLADGSSRLFSFDAAGNLRTQPGLVGVEIESANRLRRANSDHFAYNDRDHIAVRQGPSGTTRYQYNELDMLVRCDIRGEIWVADYDPLCRRVSKTWRGQTTTYYWDDFRLAAEKNHDGSLRIYVYEDHVALVPFLFIEYSSIDADPASGQRFYIFTNQIGVPIQVEDESQRSCWSARIDPYGLAHVSPGSLVEVPLRFPGHHYDPETGLHYNRFRYFSPELGRYIQEDPAGLEGGINFYAYLADPLTEADIDGLKKGGAAKPPASGKKAKGKAGKKGGCPLAAKGPAPWKGPTDYSSLTNPRGAGAGKKVTTSQKKKMYDLNRQHNGGILRDDVSGQPLVQPKKSSSSDPPPPANEAQVDHIQPRSKGGSNEYNNLQILSRADNRAKSDS